MPLSVINQVLDDVLNKKKKKNAPKTNGYLTVSKYLFFCVAALSVVDMEMRLYTQNTHSLSLLSGVNEMK